LSQVKVENSQHIDSTPSDVQANMSREKSVEKTK
jgi:prefoldin subunit 5